MNNIKYYIIIALVALGAIITIYYYDNKHKELNSKNDIYINADSIFTYKDEYDRTVSENKALLLDIETIKTLHSKEVRDLNSRINGLNNLVSTVNIKNTIVYDTVTVLKDTAIYKNNDTINTKYFNFVDRWSIINGILYKDSINLNYKINQNLFIDTYWKSDNIIGTKRELVVSVINDNPHIVTNSINSIVIKDRPKRWYETRGFAIGAGFVLGLGTGIALRK